jgi:hypothetical protein
MKRAISALTSLEVAWGFMECLYGNIVSSIGPKGIDVINSALKEGRWYISETPKDDKEDKNKSDKKKVIYR